MFVTTGILLFVFTHGSKWHTLLHLLRFPSLTNSLKYKMEVLITDLFLKFKLISLNFIHFNRIENARMSRYCFYYFVLGIHDSLN